MKDGRFVFGMILGTIIGFFVSILTVYFWYPLFYPTYNTRNMVEYKLPEFIHIDDTFYRHTIRYDFSEKDIQCLAKNIYYEARGESDLGMYAVAQVSINRWETGKFGKTLCGVIYSKNESGCAFSWVCDESLKGPVGELWTKSKMIAMDVTQHGTRMYTLDKALFYHAAYVRPFWIDDRSKLDTIGSHIFYSAAKVIIRKEI